MEMTQQHPFTDQFTNEWAWNFEHTFDKLAAASANSEDFMSRLAAMHEGLAGHKQEMADAWVAFVARKIRQEAA